MTDDLGPLLKALAHDVEVRAQLPEAEQVRHSGDSRRLGKAVGVVAAVALATTGAFGLMSRGVGSDIPAGGWDIVSGATVLPTSAPATPSQPTDVVVPPQPTWHLPGTLGVDGGDAGGNRPEGPSDRVATPGPVTAPVETSPTSAPGSTDHSVGVTVPTAPTSIPPRSASDQSPTSAPTPPTSTTTPAPTPTTTTPTSPATPAGTLDPAYAIYLYDHVGARIGTRVGSATGFSGDPSGTLPYTAVVATTAVATNVAATSPGPGVAAVGVDNSGVAHLDFFAKGVPTNSYTLGGAWADATALVALHNHATKQLTVIVFHADGRVVRHVISSAWPGATPTLDPGVVAATGLAKPTAATYARYDADAAGRATSIWTYAALGDRLALVKVNADGTSSVVELVAKGLAGTTTLARVTTGTPEVGGVGAWSTPGTGRIYYGREAYARLSDAGPAPALPN